MEDSFDYQVLNLTQQFYNDYPDPPFTEILRKNSRPYTCLLIQSRYGYFVCIPYRSHINHKHAFRFRKSVRSQRARSGLDYSKIVIAADKRYIGNQNAVIDKDEYNETRENIEYIKADAQRYIDEYVDYVLGRQQKYDSREAARIYQYSSLKYFHKELGIKDKKEDKKAAAD